jgi:hypothetical protein
MRRPITIAIATMGLVALMFWLGMARQGKMLPWSVMGLNGGPRYSLKTYSKRKEDLNQLRCGGVWKKVVR